MIFRKADKSEIEICTEIVKDAFTGYRFFEVYAGNGQQREMFFDTLMSGWIKSCYEKGVVLVSEQEKKIIAVSVLQTPDNNEIQILEKNSPISDKIIKIVGLKNMQEFLEMCDAEVNRHFYIKTVLMNLTKAHFMFQMKY